MFKHDIRSSLRLARHRPWFTAAIVGMLAFGIGATTAIFSVVHGVLLRPLPFPEPERLVQVWGSKPDRGWDQVSFTAANFWDMRDRNGTFEEFGALHGASFSLTGFAAHGRDRDPARARRRAWRRPPARGRAGHAARSGGTPGRPGRDVLVVAPDVELAVQHSALRPAHVPGRRIDADVHGCRVVLPAGAPGVARGSGRGAQDRVTAASIASSIAA